MKALLLCFCVVLLNVSYSADDLVVPNSGENSGQNKLERLGGVEKQLITLFEAHNNSRHEHQELLTQFTALKSDYQKSKEEKERLIKENGELRSDMAELKKNLTEMKRSLEQIRVSVYGEEGKKEKDELLRKK